MAFLSSIIGLAVDVMTFYLPIFYTFKFVASHDQSKVTKILKFWCVLTFSKILQYVYSKILAENLDIITDLCLSALLIAKQFEFSEKIYDSVIRPFYKNNEQTINNISKHLEVYFEKQTRNVQSKVSQSASDKIRGFIGDILVGTLNPNNKKKDRREEDRSSSHDDEDERDDREDKDD